MSRAVPLLFALSSCTLAAGGEIGTQGSFGGLLTATGGSALQALVDVDVVSVEPEAPTKATTTTHPAAPSHEVATVADLGVRLGFGELHGVMFGLQAGGGYGGYYGARDGDLARIWAGAWTDVQLRRGSVNGHPALRAEARYYDSSSVANAAVLTLSFVWAWQDPNARD